ncbi:AAA family ATPase [Candidatus Woesearchaeota archaeon]|nr:AAA family ATPase [Candidatus Woesearchaeota archaeon]
MTNYTSSMEDINNSPVLSIKQIMEADFPEIQWVIDKLLAPGLTLLAGPPKVGKSWLALQIAQAVGSGKPILGRNTKQGPCLYFALEDSPQRIRTRVDLQKWDKNSPVKVVTIGKLNFLYNKYQFDSFGEGLVNDIKQNKYRVVIIDTLSRLNSTIDQNKIDEITSFLSPLQKIGHDKNCSIILIDHHKKTNDYFDKNVISDVLGSVGKGAVPDTIIGFYRNKNKKTAELIITGRDIEDNEFPLKFDSNSGIWEIDIDAKENELPLQMSVVINFISTNGEVKEKDIVEHLKKDKGNVHKLLSKMVKENLLTKKKSGKSNIYSIPQ